MVASAVISMIVIVVAMTVIEKAAVPTLKKAL